MHTLKSFKKKKRKTLYTEHCVTNSVVPYNMDQE